MNKVGDARVGFVGFPSVGKSTLLTKLTGTFSESAEYEFTTLTAVLGTLRYRGARIQLLDLPGIIEGAKDGKGRGRQVIGESRMARCRRIVDVSRANRGLLIPAGLPVRTRSDGADVRPNSDLPGRDEAHHAQEDYREGAGGVRHPPEQVAAQH